MKRNNVYDRSETAARRWWPFRENYSDDARRVSYATGFRCGYRAAQRDARNRSGAVKHWIRQRVNQCCGARAGKTFCETFGCGSMMKVVRMLEGEKERTK